VPSLEPYQRLEEEFGKWAGCENVVAVSSGTAALHLALEALRLPPGSEVLLGDFNMVACARAVAMAGLVPVFIDCGHDLLIDKQFAGAAITDNTSAVMLVNIYGRLCDLTHFALLSQKHGIAVVEDCAESHGANHVTTWKPHARAWSFYRNKVVAGEEGGAVAFRDPLDAILARQLRSLGFTDAHDFNHVPRGHNYRLANTAATLILHSLERAEANIRKRSEIEGWYDALCPQEWKMPPRAAKWVYDLRLPGMDHPQQNEIVKRLQAAGIQARHGFKTMSSQPEFKDCRLVGNGAAYRAAREVIYLPISPGATTKESVQLAFNVLARS
jgi:dTDP-4-amino-4,6-dideoxygalactose transaminase